MTNIKKYIYSLCIILVESTSPLDSPHNYNSQEGHEHVHKSTIGHFRRGGSAHCFCWYLLDKSGWFPGGGGDVTARSM